MFSQGGERRQNEFREQDEYIEPLLNEKDREVIGRGLRKLLEILNATPDRELPNIILFPDTAARPLAYAVKPVLDALYASKGQATPDYRFIVLHSGPSELSYMRPDEHWEENRVEYIAKYLSMAEEGLRDSVTSLLEEMDKSVDDSLQSWEQRSEIRIDFFASLVEKAELEIRTVPERAEELKQTWLALHDRLKEIVADSLNARVLVIDDYVYRGASLQMLDDAFDDTVPSVDRQYFSFVVNEDAKNKIEKQIPDFTYGTSTADDNFEDYRGFDYRTLDLGMFSEPNEVLLEKKRKVEPVIGVKKNLGDKYSISSPVANSKEMNRLRLEMKTQGELVAKEVIR